MGKRRMGHRMLQAFEIGMVCLLFLCGCVIIEWQERVIGQRKQLAVPAEGVAEECVPDEEGDLSEVKLLENEEVVVYEDRAFYRFVCEEDNLGNAASYVRKVQESCPGLKQIYVMPVPPRVLIEEGYDADRENYAKYVKRLRQLLPEKGVLLEVSERMEQHKSEEVFYPTENAWTAEGAYYGAQAFLEATEREGVPLEQYEKYEGNEFLGNMELHEEIAAARKQEVSLVNNRLRFYRLRDAPQRVEVIGVGEQGGQEQYKKPLFTPSSINLASVIDSTYARAIVEGESIDGRNTENYLLVICDVVGSWVVPYLKDYYAGVYVINICEDSYLYKDLDDLVEKYGITEALWVQTAAELGKAGYDKAMSVKE